MGGACEGRGVRGSLGQGDFFLSGCVSCAVFVSLGSVRFVAYVRFCYVCYVSFSFVYVRFCSVWFFSLLFFSVLFGSHRFGSARFGSVRFGSVQFVSILSYPVPFGWTLFSLVGSFDFRFVPSSSVSCFLIRLFSVSVLFGYARLGSVRSASVRIGSVLFGFVRFCWVQLSPLRLNFVEFCSILFGSVSLISAPFSSVWLTSVSARFCLVGSSVRFGLILVCSFCLTTRVETDRLK